MNGVAQANPIAFDGWTSLLACNVAAFYCPNPTPLLHLQVEIPATSLVSLGRAQLVYDIRSVFAAGIATLTVNGQLVGVMPGHATVPGTGDSEWAHRSIDVDKSHLHAGTNSFDIAMPSDVELDRLQLELGSQSPAPPAATSAGFFPLSPCRLLDTRDAIAALGGPVLAGGTARIVTVSGACGIPSSARSISANVTVVSPGSGGNLRVYPADFPTVPTTAISFQAGRVRANNAVLLLSTDGSGGVTIQNDSPEPSHVVLDVNGYFQ